MGLLALECALFRGTLRSRPERFSQGFAAEVSKLQQALGSQAFGGAALKVLEFLLRQSQIPVPNRSGSQAIGSLGLDLEFSDERR